MNWKKFLLFSVLLISVAHAQWATEPMQSLMYTKSVNFKSVADERKREADPFTRANSPKVYFKTEDELSIFRAKQSTNPCKPTEPNLDSPAFEMYNFSNNISYKVSAMYCFEIMTSDKKPYSEAYCNGVTNCARAKLSEFPTGAKVGLLVQEILADDYIQQELKSHIQDMEKFENLMKFLDKKYPGQVPLKCDSRFAEPAVEQSCISSIRKNFMAVQKGCHLPYSNCYLYSSSSGEGYEEFEAKNQGTYNNAFNKFFNQRTDIQVENKLKNDDEGINELLTILAGKGSDKEKEEKFFQLIKDPVFNKKLDPVVTFYNTNSPMEYKNEAIKSRFGKFVEEALKEKKSLSELKNDFHGFRQALGFQLINENCKDIPSYDNICVNSEIINGGTSESKVTVNKMLALTNRDADLYNINSPRLKTIMDQIPDTGDEIIPDKMPKLTKARILLESARCNSFTFENYGVAKKTLITELLRPTKDYTKSGIINGESLLKLGQSEDKNLSSKERIALARERKKEFKEKLQREAEDKGRNPETGERESNIKLKSRSGESSKESLATSSRKMDFVEPSELNKAESKVNTSHSIAESRMQSDFSKVSIPSIPQPLAIPIPQPITAQPVQPVDVNTNANIVNAKAESLKIAPKKVEIEKEKKNTEKIQTDYSSIDELKALRNELSSLKETMQKNSKDSSKEKDKTASQAASNVNVVSNIRNQDSRNLSNSEESETGYSFSSPKSETANKNSAGSSSSSSSSSSTYHTSDNGPDSSTERSNSPIHSKSEALRLTSNSSNPRGNDNFALVLNTQETTVEQNEQAIVDNILVNNGKIFEIMMDGVAVKVVPFVEKGKLVFEKGKPKYKIFVRDEKTTKNTSTVGDLKIQQEAEVKKAADRAQYIKLKELTKSALKEK
jgi:hypothetical protein